MFRLVLAILLPMNNDSAYIFRLVLDYLWHIDKDCSYMFSASVSHSVAY